MTISFAGKPSKTKILDRILVLSKLLEPQTMATKEVREAANLKIHELISLL